MKRTPKRTPKYMAIDTKQFINKIQTNLKADKDFKIFFYTFVQDGKKFRGLIDTTEKTMWGKRDRISFAQSELINIQSKRKNNIDENVKLDIFMEKHFSFLPEGKWKKIQISYYERYISKQIGNRSINTLRQIDIRNVIKKQEELELSARTVKSVLEILNPAFKEAIANRLIMFNPCDGVAVKRPKTKKMVSNATDELINIYKAIMDVFKDDVFYRAFFLFALQGRRKGEILNLMWNDISFEHNYYIIRDTKNDETQKMFLPDTIKNILTEFVDYSNKYVFTSRKTGGRLQNIEHNTKKLKTKLNNPNFTVHYLRNVITSAMGEQGIEAIYQSGALGHNDLTTINKYSSLNYLKGSKMASDIIDGILVDEKI